MKTRWWMSVMLAVMLAAVSFAQTTNVYSRNAVGVIKVNIQGGVWHLITCPLDSMGVSNLVRDVIGTNDVPPGTKVLFFDGTSYLQEQLLPNRVWWPGTNTITRGVGFWIRSPTSWDLYLTGEVPSVSTSLVHLATIFTLVGFPYPVDTPITNTQLRTIGSVGDKIIKFTGSNYVQAQYVPGIGWFPQDFTVRIGEGFWYRTGVTKTWSEPKVTHYTYP